MTEDFETTLNGEINTNIFKTDFEFNEISLDNTFDIDNVSKTQDEFRLSTICKLFLYI